MVDLAQPLADALFVAAVAVWTVAGKLLSNEEAWVVRVCERDRIDGFDFVVATLFDAKLVAERVISWGAGGGGAGGALVEAGHRGGGGEWVMLGPEATDAPAFVAGDAKAAVGGEEAEALDVAIGGKAVSEGFQRVAVGAGGLFQPLKVGRQRLGHEEVHGA